MRTPLAVFTLPQQLVVPLFQRPYVWDEENQWEPLWQDIRRLAEHQLTHPGTPATHFLGAVVIQAAESTYGAMQSWSIIDGQQRLTTLQVVFDAAAAAFDVLGFDQLSGQVEALTHNPGVYIGEGDVALKLRHTNRDRAAFDEVMLADPPIAYDELEHRTSLLARGHRYFSDQVTAWLSDLDAAAPYSAELRARALTNVLTQSLQIVVIDLRADENSQEIFETLNARGTPLTAADLIKNFVFQRLAAEKVDTQHAYRELWPFETKFWEKELSVGRTLVSRGSLFLNQWLISRVGEEIGPKATFARFKHYVEHQAGASMRDLLAVIKEQADQYEAWTLAADDPHRDLGVVEMNVYRTQSAETEVLKPVLLWLTRPGAPYSAGTVERVVAMLEAWLVRRLMLRLPSGDHGRVIAELVRVHRAVDEVDLAARVEDYLTSQRAESTYWPGDDELRAGLATENAYRRFKRRRLRMLLEAVEDAHRGYAEAGHSRTGMRVPRLGFPIEHLLPQKWATHWPVDDLAAEVERDGHVHRLGNLTLITTSLNSAVSNGPWGGEKGKRAQLEKHDVLLMNRRVREISSNGWDEQLIDARTAEMVDALLATWPAPEGHQGVVTAHTASSSDDYIALKELVAADVLPAGTVLHARPGSWGHAECTVLPNGDLELAGNTYSSPSGAGRQIRKGSTNGWVFWELPDGRRLKDLRAVYLSSRG
ncbi:GmrSD restriction endonuclease domain-containing protein [Nocardioides salarius]|uniref:GmrSD restriction endonuclease domain-containing protein n=1 Tax=Nocardioides salarius TaxID=374513 RepID=UPI0030FC5A56